MIASQFGINLVCKNDYRLSRLVGVDNSMTCGHDQPVGDIIKGVVYEITVAYAFRYVGHIECYLNERMMAHTRGIKFKASESQPAHHYYDCRKCYTRWDK